MVSWKRNVRETWVDLSVQFDFVKTVQSDLDKTWNLGRNFSQSPNHFAHFDDRYRILSKPCVKSRKSLISINLPWLRSSMTNHSMVEPNSHNNVKLQWVILNRWTTITETFVAHPWRWHLEKLAAAWNRRRAIWWAARGARWLHTEWSIVGMGGGGVMVGLQLRHFLWNWPVCCWCSRQPLQLSPIRTGAQLQHQVGVARGGIREADVSTLTRLVPGEACCWFHFLHLHWHWC